jgi:hypothetical protein
VKQEHICSNILTQKHKGPKHDENYCLKNGILENPLCAVLVYYYDPILNMLKSLHSKTVMLQEKNIMQYKLHI